MSDNLDSRVLNWLQKEGFPLEMRAAAAFRRDGFGTSQGSYFQDPQSGEWRETDIEAYQEASYDDATVRVTFAVECKLSRNHPWIVFTEGVGVPRVEAHLLWAPTNTMARGFPGRLRRSKEFVELPLFRGTCEFGYGVTQALGNRDLAYAAVMSVAKAAVARTIDSDKESEIDPVVEIVFPTLVVDAPIFLCHLSSAGEPELVRVSDAILHWRNPAVGRGITAVALVSADILSEYAASATESANHIIMHCREQVDLTVRELRRRQRASAD